jgi:hypothetical protein
MNALKHDRARASDSKYIDVYSHGPTRPGESATGTLVLSGTANFNYVGDWTRAQPIYFANAARGFNHVDDVSVSP